MKLCELASGSYHPTQHERVVLSLCLICDTPQLAATQSSKSQQLSYARNNLIKLGFILGNDSAIELTDAGKDLTVQQALADDFGAPNDTAKQAASEVGN